MSPLSSFAALGVPEPMLPVLDRQGIRAPFPIQSATIPDALAGRDVLGRAPTGSGKTLAFGIPLLANVGRAEPRLPTALILSPTRELAEQIRRELEPLARASDRNLLAVYGGVGFGPQLRALQRGVDVLVACPGRLLDLLDKDEVSLSSVTHVVVDEADRMADMGFLPDVRRLLDRTPAREQTVLFSATLGPEVRVLTDRYQADAITHHVGEAEPDMTLMTHRFVHTDRHAKVSLAAHFIAEAGPTVVFCRTRYGVDRVARQLKNAGIKNSHIHGNRSQNQRDTALAAFTSGKVTALVATDVAARGIHVDGVACVIHFDPPEDHTAYLHRSGRTARAGARGLVISFVNTDQMKGARKLQRTIGLDAVYEDPPIVDTAAQHAAAAAIRTDRSRTNGGGAQSTEQTGPHPRRQGHSKNRSQKNGRHKPRRASSSGSRSPASKPKPAERSGTNAKPVKKKHAKRTAASGGPRSKQKRQGAKQRRRGRSTHRGQGGSR